jgi:hypothetical protein
MRLAGHGACMGERGVYRIWWRDWGEGKFVSKKAKLKLYLTIIRPLITYGSEIWVLKQSMKQKLLTEKKSIKKNIRTYKGHRWCTEI